MNPLNAPARQSAVIHGMAAADYFAAPGLSHSGMKKLHPTPAHFLVRDDDEQEVTVDMVMGTMVHTLVLDPESPLPKVAVLPKEYSLTTKAGRTWRDEQNAAGFCVLKPEAVVSVREQALSLSRNRGLNRVLRSGYSEVSYFRTVETAYGPLVLKARADFVPTGQPFLIDLKTCHGADEHTFQRVVTNKRYFSQAAHYLDMHNACCPDDPRNDLYFYVVEKKKPHAVACYRLTSDFLELGRQQVEEDIRIYAECLLNHKFPGFPDDVMPIDPPLWLRTASARERWLLGTEDRA